MTKLHETYIDNLEKEIKKLEEHLNLVEPWDKHKGSAFRNGWNSALQKVKEVIKRNKDKQFPYWTLEKDVWKLEKLKEELEGLKKQ